MQVLGFDRHKRTVCCVSDDGALVVRDTRTHRQLARVDTRAALRRAGWGEARRVCGCALCPYDSRYAVVSASDAQATMGVALLDLEAAECVSYTTKSYLAAVRARQRPRMAAPATSTSLLSSSVVAGDGTVIEVPSLPPPDIEYHSHDGFDDDSGSARGCEAAAVGTSNADRLNQRGGVVCLSASQSTASGAVSAVVHAPEGLLCMALPQQAPASTSCLTPAAKRINWDDQAVVAALDRSRCPTHDVDRFALHPQALLGDTLLCTAGSSVFHVSIADRSAV